MEIHRKDGEIEERPKSKGGKIFDWITYAGFAGVGTFIITLPVAHALKYGKGLAWYERMAQRLEQHGLNWLPKGVRHDVAQEGFMTTLLMQGGNLMLIPVTLMEHFRTHIVNGLNRMYKDPTDPESVKDAPPQTIGSILKGRALAWSVVFTSLLSTSLIFPDTFRTYKDEFGRMVCTILGKATEEIRVVKGEKKLMHTTPYEYGELAALDVFATTAAAILLYVGSISLLKRQKRNARKKWTRPVTPPPTPRPT